MEILDNLELNMEQHSEEYIKNLYHKSGMIKFSSHTEYSPALIQELITKSPELKDKILFFNGGMVGVNLDNYEPQQGDDELRFSIYENNVSDSQNFEKLLKFARLEPRAKFHAMFEDAGKISVEQLKKLRETGMDLEISIIKEGNEDQQNAEYDLDTFIAIREKLDEVVEGIDLNLPEKEKFKMVYERIGKNIVYDTPAAYPKTEEEGIYCNENVVNCRNLRNGLLDGKCVCAGYADILRNALALVGIEAQYVSGPVLEETIKKSKYKPEEHKTQYIYSETDKRYTLAERHAWNKVKLDGEWYNVDPTWDADLLRRRRAPTYCLKTDDQIRDKDKKTDFNGEPCVTEVDKKEIIDLFKGKHLHIGKFTIPNVRDFIDICKEEIEDYKETGKQIIDFFSGIKKKITDALSGSKTELLGTSSGDSKEEKLDSSIDSYRIEEYGKSMDEFAEENIRKVSNNLNKNNNTEIGKETEMEDAGK